MSRPLSKSNSRFLTPKSRGVIPIDSELRHDALRLLALDPEVSRIEYVPSAVVDRHLVSLGCLLVERAGRRELVEIVDRHDALRDIDSEGLHLLACRSLAAMPVRLCRAEIEREPRAHNVRQIWAHHDRFVSLDARLKIAKALTPGPVALGRLCSQIGEEIRSDIFSLACQVVVSIDPFGDLKDAPVKVATTRSAVLYGVRP